MSESLDATCLRNAVFAAEAAHSKALQTSSRDATQVCEAQNLILQLQCLISGAAAAPTMGAACQAAPLLEACVGRLASLSAVQQRGEDRYARWHVHACMALLPGL